MKALIIYFSQSGFTRKVAEHIHKGIGSVAQTCDLMDLTEVNSEAVGDYDLVGLGCPVFYLRDPHNVHVFIKELPELKDKQWFVFCTHGSIMGNTLTLMAKALKQKGILVVGYHDTYSDGTIPFYPYPTLTTGHPDQQEYEEARAFGEDVSKLSKRIANGEPNLIPEPATEDPRWTELIEMYSPDFLAKHMPNMQINVEKCINCKKCEENCPVAGIDVEASPPRIQKPCIYCWYCTKTCPTGAIEADWESAVAMAPQSYGLYRATLEEEAAKGKYRWLIDPDTIDFNNPLHKQRVREIAKNKENNSG